MKQHILDLRRAMRKEGCDLNGTLYTFPDVEKWLQAANDTARAYFDKHRQALGRTAQSFACFPRTPVWM